MWCLRVKCLCSRVDACGPVVLGGSWEETCVKISLCPRQTLALLSCTHKHTQLKIKLKRQSKKWWDCLIFKEYVLIVYKCICMLVYRCHQRCEGQKSSWERWFSPPTVWVQGIELRLLGLVAMPLPAEPSKQLLFYIYWWHWSYNYIYMTRATKLLVKMLFLNSILINMTIQYKTFNNAGHRF